MKPDQIIAEMATIYATCASYRDTGKVVTRFLLAVNHQPHTSVLPFATAFVRPDRFRFEYRHRYKTMDEWNRYIVWANGSDVKTWWSVCSGVKHPPALGLALAGATGVSGGSAHTIPALLIPDKVGGLRLTDFAEVTSLADEFVGAIPCFRLSIRFTPPMVDAAEEEQQRAEMTRVTGRPRERCERGPTTIWIDRATLLIRRIDKDSRFETFRAESTTEYEPAVGATITDDELQFGAPELGNASQVTTLA